MSPPGCALRARISSGSTSRLTRASSPSSARSSVLEKTTFGIRRQIPANSLMGPVLDGSESAVGQNPDISW
jgi:hypothetical protein